MNELLVYTVDMNTYYAVRGRADLDKWLQQNGVVVEDTFRFEYHRHMEKLWVSSYLRDENGNFYLGPDKSEAVRKLRSVPVVVPPSQILLEDLTEAMELVHGD